MKRAIRIISVLVAALLLFGIALFLNDLLKFTNEVTQYSKKNHYTELNNNNALEIKIKEQEPSQNHQQNDSLLQISLINQYEDLRKKIENKEINEITKHINFPLGPRSGYAFGYEAKNDTVFLTHEKFISGFDSFFRKPFLDSLRSNKETFEVYKKSDQIRWSIHINTWDPANKIREWGIECSHSMWGYATDSILIIDGFNLLCGGVM